MRPLARLLSWPALVALLGGLTFAGCNTIEGAGKDIKSAGKAIEEEADEHH